MKAAVLTFVLLALFCVGISERSEGRGLPAGAQDATARQQTPEETTDKKALTDIDVLNKFNAGDTDAEIIKEIETTPTVFDISQPSLVFLKKHGVSQTVVNAMVKAAGGKPAPVTTVVPAPVAVPPPVKPATVEPSPTPPAALEAAKSTPAPNPKPKSPKPDMHKVRKVFLEMDWADDATARPRAIASLEKRTCLKVVDSLDAADAKLVWTNQGVMGVNVEMFSKSDVEFWSRRSFISPLKALREALGCE